MEEDILGFVHQRSETSRLSCQVTLDDSLDGVVVHIPASQF